MQDFSVASLDDEAINRNFGQFIVPEQVKVVDFLQTGDDALVDIFLELADCFYAYLFSQLVDQTCTNVLNDTGSACFFELLNIRNKIVVFFIHEKDWASSDTIR